MRPKIIFFFTGVSLAVLTVVLLALFSPVRNHKNTAVSFALSLYIQQYSQPTKQPPSPETPLSPSGDGALVFHRTLTEGPENTSRIVGKAQGFIVPIEHFAHSEFNIIYLTFRGDDYAGSLSIEAKNFDRKDDRGQLTVVGGTGSFAFARGFAVFSQADRRYQTYHLNLHLNYPNRSHTVVPG